MAHHLSIGDGAVYADFIVDEKHPKESCLKIYSPRHKFQHVVQGSPFLYLLESVNQGKEQEVEAYVAMIWRISQEVYKDIDLCKDLIAALRARDERLLEQARKQAAQVSAEREAGDQALMSDIAREADRQAREADHSRPAEAQGSGKEG